MLECGRRDRVGCEWGLVVPWEGRLIVVGCDKIDRPEG